MKLSKYLESVRQEDPGFDKLVREIMEWTPPPSKIKIFLDENLPQELKNELKSFSKFKVVKTAQGESDETIFNFCSNKLIMKICPICGLEMLKPSPYYNKETIQCRCMYCGFLLELDRKIYKESFDKRKQLE